MKPLIQTYILLLLICINIKGFAQETDINQAFTLNSEGKYDEAAELFTKWLPKAKKKFGGNDTSVYLKLLSWAGVCHLQAGQYEQAEPQLIEAVQITKRSLGETHPSYGITLVNLTQVYQALGLYEKAEPLMIETLRIFKESLGEDSPLYGKSLNNLARLYQDMGRYKLAEPLLKEAVQIIKKSLGVKHPDYALSLNNLAMFYYDIGLFTQVEPLMNEVIRINKESFGVHHPSYGNSLNNIVTLYKEMGRYAEAESLMNEAVRIDKESFGENHPSYGIRLNNLAQLYQEMGRYEEAEPLMKEVLRISKESFGDNHPSYASDLNNLALLYQDMGRYDQAESLLKEAILIVEGRLEENHPDYGSLLNNLGNLYENMGRYAQAEMLFIKVLKVDEIQLGKNHPSYAKDLNNLSALYHAMGQYEKAEPLMKEALRIVKETLGENNPSYGICLNNLGQFYQETRQYELAEPLMKEAIRIDIESLGTNSPSYFTSLNNLASLYVDMGLYEQAEPLMIHSFSSLRQNFKNNSGYLSETELSQFLESFLFYTEAYQSFNHQQFALKSAIGAFAMDIELYRKGLLLNSVIETRKRILNSGDTSLINSYQTMMAYRKQADKLNSITKEQRYDDPVLLEAKANDLEKFLKLQSKEYSRNLEEVEITWKQLQEKLKPDEAVVEFENFGYYNKQWTDSTLYCALVLRKKDTMPHMVYLFEEKQLAEALPKLENNSDNAINNIYSVLRGNELIPDSSWFQGGNLYNLIWKPLDSLLSGIKTISYACSGLLNTVSLAAIPDSSGKLLCEKYALNQYSSTRNLAIETKELPITDATIYGGIQYELDTTLMIANSRQYSKSDSIALAYNSTRSGNKRGNGFDELEGTREEAIAVSKLFKEKKIATNNYTGATANEESFKAMAGRKSPSVIHLSTHGFYFPDTVTQLKRSNELQFMGSDLNRFQYSPDPLLRSGIVLAGANRVWRGEPVPDGVEDGILTAKDVSQLNLSNTQLVVLSACQTGLGDVKGSEGVFGLQRAFKMAGVKYLIMSLWSVPDKETKDFMEKFYSHWLSGIPIQQAFQSTQQEMRFEYPKEPYKWAAFVLVQ